MCAAVSPRDDKKAQKHFIAKLHRAVSAPAFLRSSSDNAGGQSERHGIEKTDLEVTKITRHDGISISQYIGQSRSCSANINDTHRLGMIPVSVLRASFQIII
jgi:hypothetical protein